MNTCEKFKTFQNGARLRNASFVAEQPEVCGSCDEKKCKITDGIALFPAVVVTADETDANGGLERFALLAAGKERVKQFHKKLERHQVLYQASQSE